jgi:alpha-L-rhamnosidase
MAAVFLKGNASTIPPGITGGKFAVQSKSELEIYVSNLKRKSLSILLSLAPLLGAYAYAASEAPAIIESSMISGNGYFPAQHGSTIVEITGQSKLLACWYAGDREGGREVQIYCKQSPLGEINWSSIGIAVASAQRQTGDFKESRTVGNPVLFYDQESQLTYLFFGTVTIGGWGGIRPFYKISKDFGSTWSKSIPIEAAFPSGENDFYSRLGKFVRIKPILVNGKLLLPMYYEHTKKRVFTCVFTKSNPKDIFKETSCAVAPGNRVLQPSMVVKDGVIHTYARGREGFVEHGIFDINTMRWSEFDPINVPNPNSSVDSILTYDNKILLVGNPDSSDRYPMALLVSDDAINFKQVYAFDGSKAENLEYSYPALIKTSDGFYHLTYTYKYRGGIKHVRFNQPWLDQKLK